MSLWIEFAPYGIAQYSRMYSRFADGVHDLRPLWSRYYANFLAMEREQFATQGGHGSGGWASLKEPYRSWKMRVRPGRLILEFDGDLKNSLTQRGAKGSICRINTGWAEFGSSIPYGIYHAKGTGKMKKRPPIEMSESDRTAWDKTAHGWLYETMRERLQA